MKKNNIILASASPRRRELLKMIFNDFRCIAADIPEVVPDNTPIENIPEYLAKIKAEYIAKANPDCLVIGADTAVLAEGKILGKPKTKPEAAEMLNLLSGKVHKVITGCAIISKDTTYSFSSVTEVEFFKLSNSEIEEYISICEPYDKAGGYGIQSGGGLFVKQIVGDYYNVVGLPIAELNRVLKLKFLEV